MMNRAIRSLLVPALALLAALLSLPALAAYVDNGDGTVTDTVTGLMWDKCPDGQTANDCSGGSAFRFTWANALARPVVLNSINYKGHNDWRLPSIRELESLVLIRLTHPAIDDVAFPNTDVTQWYWSSTLTVHDVTAAWAVPFQTGDVNGRDWTLSANNSFVRVVRGGQPGEAFDLLAPPPVLQSVVLRRVHGGTGTFDLTLSSVLTNPTTEPRTGPNHQLIFTYDKPLNAATATATEGVATLSTSVVGSTVVVNLSGVTNAQYVTVTLSGVGSTDGATGGTGVARAGFLQGDVNQNRVVSFADVGLVNAQLAQPVTLANFLMDINASGAISLADKVLANNALSTSLPGP
jgi:hypothetical protein